MAEHHFPHPQTKLHVAGYGGEDTGTMAEYLVEELARREKTGESRPVPPKPKKPRKGALADTTTDYPWLRADWVEPKVDPLRLRNRR